MAAAKSASQSVFTWPGKRCSGPSPCIHDLHAWCYNTGCCFEPSSLQRLLERCREHPVVCCGPISRNKEQQHRHTYFRQPPEDLSIAPSILFEGQGTKRTLSHNNRVYCHRPAGWDGHQALRCGSRLALCERHIRQLHYNVLPAGVLHPQPPLWHSCHASILDMYATLAS